MRGVVISKDSSGVKSERKSLQKHLQKQRHNYVVCGELFMVKRFKIG